MATTQDPISVKRSGLYNQVWAEPMTNVAKKYGLNDSGLRKICWRYNVPVPETGPWAKTAHGSDMKAPPLRNPDHDPSIEIYPHCAGLEIADEEQWRKAQILIADEDVEKNLIVILPHLQDPDPLIARTEKSLRSSAADLNGICHPKAKNSLDAHVSKQGIDRAMRIMDGLVKAAYKRGFSISTASADSVHTTVEILGEKVRFNLEELLDRKEKDYSAEELQQRKQYPTLYRSPVYVYFPNGKLRLQIDNSHYNMDGLRQTWADGKEQRLEDCLNSFVIGLVRASVAERNTKIERDRQQREMREAEKRRHELAQLKYEEEKKLKSLEQQVDAWLKSRNIRAFTDAVRQSHASAGKEITPGGELDTWLKWVGQQADRFDPMVKSPPSVLDEPAW